MSALSGEPPLLSSRHFRQLAEVALRWLIKFEIEGGDPNVFRQQLWMVWIAEGTFHYHDSHV
jgi:hypothetical protein